MQQVVRDFLPNHPTHFNKQEASAPHKRIVNIFPFSRELIESNPFSPRYFLIINLF